MEDFWEKCGKYVSIGFLGCGNMGMAMLKALLKGFVESEREKDKSKFNFCGNIKVYDPNISESAFKKLVVEKVANNDVQVVNNMEHLLFCDVLVLAVKPQIFKEVIGGFFKSNQPATTIKTSLVVSIMAGISCKKMKNGFEAAVSKKSNNTIIDEEVGAKIAALSFARIMPNLPLTVGLGAGAYCCSSQESIVAEGSEVKPWNASIIKFFLEGFTRPMGKFFAVDEPLMDVVTAVSGSGPAYFCAFLEEMIKAAVKNGLSREAAQALCVQTFFGTADLLKKNSESHIELRKRVTSPGGTTEAGLKSLQSPNFADAVEQCITSAKMRGIELGLQ